MPRKCDISGKMRLIGHRVSHANNKTLHAFKPNLLSKRVFIPEEKRFVRLRVTAKVLRTIDRIGLSETLKKFKITVADLA